MRNEIILLSTLLILLVQSTRAQYDDELLKPKGPPLPDTRPYLDSAFLNQKRDAAERFLARTRFTPSASEFAGFYVSPHPLSRIFRLRPDSSAYWTYDVEFEDTASSLQCQLDGPNVRVFPDVRPEALTPLEELSRSTLVEADTFEFHRVDTLIFLIHSSVLNSFAEYFFTAKGDDIWNHSYFRQVFVKSDTTQLNNSHYPNSDAGMDTIQAMYAVLILAFWFGGGIYASVVLNRISKAVTRIEGKLDNQTQNKTAQPPGH